MPVTIKGSGGGSVTLDAGAAAADTTLTIPNVNGTVLQSGTVVSVAQGGTGATTLAANNVLLGNGTSALQTVAPGTSGNVLNSSGTTWQSSALSGGTGISISGLTVTNTGVTSFSGGSTGLTPATATTGAIALAGTLAVANGGTGLATLTAANNALYSTSSSAMTAGTLPVAAGGTGAATLTANAVLIGNGTSAVTAVAPSTAGNVLTSNGTTWASTAPASPVPTPSAIGQIPFSTDGSTYTATQKITQGTAVASTSGTAIDFTSIPSWVKRITVMFTVMSTNGSSSVQAQIGSTSGGIENTGYTFLLSVSQSGVQYYTITSGFGLTGGTSGGWTAAGYVYTGVLNLSSFGSNTWVADVRLSGGSGTTNQYFGTGYKTLSDVLSQVRITTVNGTDTFDAGSINILYE